LVIDSYVRRLTVPLLVDRSHHVRQFAGPGLAYLLRNLSQKDLELACRSIYEEASAIDVKNDQLFDGFSGLLFEAIKGPSGCLHSRAPLILRSSLSLLNGQSLPSSKWTRQLLVFLFKEFTLCF
jgi:hypothetical protein